MADDSRSPEAADSLRKLEALFGGSTTLSPPLRENPRPRHATPGPRPERVFASPRKSTGRSPSEFRLRLERIRMAREDEELEQAANVFLAHHQLPDEVDILLKLLRHSGEGVVRDALGQLSSLLTQGRINSSGVLRDRLKDIEARATEEATHAYVKGVRDQLDKLEL